MCWWPRESEFILPSKTTSRSWRGGEAIQFAQGLQTKESKPKCENPLFSQAGSQPTASSPVGGCAIALFSLSLLLSLTLRSDFFRLPFVIINQTLATILLSSLNSHPYIHTHTTNTLYPDNHQQPSLTPWTCPRQSVKSTQRYSQVSTPSTATSLVIPLLFHLRCILCEPLVVLSAKEINGQPVLRR